MTKSQKKATWLKIAALAENPNTGRAFGLYRGMCFLVSEYTSWHNRCELIRDFEFAMNANVGPFQYYWPTRITVTDNGDRILAAYFMAYSGIEAPNNG